MTPNTRTVLLTSFASALVMGLSLVFITWGVNLNKGIDAPGNLSIAFGVGLIIGFSMGIGLWVNRYAPKAKVLETVIEKPAEPQRFSVIQDADTPYPRGFYDLPKGITIDHMIEFARQVLALRGDISHGALAGKGKPFSRTEYESIRNYALLRKWIKWNNEKYKQQGLTMRKLGLDAFEQLLTPYPTSVLPRAYGQSGREDTHAHTRTQGVMK